MPRVVVLGAQGTTSYNAAVGGPRMEVTAKIGVADYARFKRHMVFHHRANQIILCLVSLATFLALCLTTEELDPLTVVIFAGSGVVAGVGGMLAGYLLSLVIIGFAA